MPKSHLSFFLSCLGFLISSLGLLGAAKPNVLIIIADDCTFSDLPLNGGQNAKTPHLDALTKQSLVFDRAYVQVALCGPSSAFPPPSAASCCPAAAR